MSAPEVHVVNGTTFRFPALPPREWNPEVVDRLRAQRDEILLMAASSRPPKRCSSGGLADSPYRRAHVCRDPYACRLATLRRKDRLT